MSCTRRVSRRCIVATILAVLVAANVAGYPKGMHVAAAHVPPVNDTPNTPDTIPRYAVQLTHASGIPYTAHDAELYAATHGLLVEMTITGLPGYFVVAGSTADTEWPQLLARDSDTVRWLQKQVPVSRSYRILPSKTVTTNTSLSLRDVNNNNNDNNQHMGRDSILHFTDPQFPAQWYLNNDGSNGLWLHHDSNVVPVWQSGITGRGVVVSVLDDGVDYTHPEFANVWRADLAYDFDRMTNDPLPQSNTEVHGTRCAGEIAAQPNTKCGVGVAYGAQLTAERVISDEGHVIDAVEAQALLHRMHDITIYTASWGPNDDGGTVDGPGELATLALHTGATEGRNGYGSIYVFASGNGGEEGDNCNFDGFANSIYTISIGAVMYNGERPSYGELCSAHIGVMYSSGNGLSITTTDPNNGCTSTHGGTSAAAPLVAGIVALMLEARPQLSWRDVQQIIVDTAIRNDESDSSWHINGAGRYVSHKYGFGLIDAHLAVERAKTQSLLPIEQLQVNVEGTGGTISPRRIMVTSVDVSASDALTLSSLEHVSVGVQITHPERRYLRITITSPKGTRSVLAEPRANDKSKDGLRNWNFTTLHSWSETPIGRWTLEIEDVRGITQDVYSKQPYTTGTLDSWRLALHGTCASSDIVQTDNNSGPGGGRMCIDEKAFMARRKGRVLTFVLGCTATLVIIIYLAYNKLKTGLVVMTFSNSTKRYESLPLTNIASTTYDVESPPSVQFLNSVESPAAGSDYYSPQQYSSSGRGMAPQRPTNVNVDIDMPLLDADIPYDHLSPFVSPTRDTAGDQMSHPIVSNLRGTLSNNMKVSRTSDINSPW